MKTLRTSILLASFLITSISLTAQETTIQLPTNDNTSSLNVTKKNGSSVFKVNGAGQMAGDASGLSNVKSIANTTGGNQLCQITKNYAWYQNVRSVTITTPSSGKCFVMASGYVRWESKGWDLLLASILRNSDPNESWDDENEFFRYLNLMTDYNCTDSSDQYVSFAQHRCFNVGSGTQTFTLWANKYTSSAKVRVDDVNISVIFIPTGGVGSASTVIASTELNDNDETAYSFEDLQNRKEALKRTLDGTINGRRGGTPLEDSKKGINSKERINALERKVEDLNNKIEMLLKKVE